MNIKELYSPNYDSKKRPLNSIKFLIIHYTGMQSERESIVRLCNPDSKVSSHYLINENGKIYRMVKDKNIAWHAGKSIWDKYKDLNKNSIGIELVNKGHQFGYSNFKKKQILSLLKLCKNLVRKYKIINKNILGHSDIAPVRKIDPGEKFPWEQLAKKNIGIWHTCKPNLLKSLRKKKIINAKDKKKFIKNLKKIGYHYQTKQNYFLEKVIKAFQRHYRKQLINGKPDRECLIISENLIKNI